MKHSFANLAATAIARQVLLPIRGELRLQGAGTDVAAGALLLRRADRLRIRLRIRLRTRLPQCPL